MQPTAADQIRFRLRVRHDLPSPTQRRALREASGLTQQELADAIGVTPQAISLYEAGKRMPRGDRLDRYADALRAIREAAA